MDRLFSKHSLYCKLIILSGFLLIQACQTSNSQVDLYVGTYTQKEGHVDGKAEGIYVLSFDTDTGKLNKKATIQGITNPSYLDFYENRIYAVSEIGDQDSGGLLKVFENSGGDWKSIQEIETGGAWPCHVSIEAKKKKLHVANYSGSVSHFDVLPNGKTSLLKTRKLKANESNHPRQEGAHAHMVKSFNDVLLVADLGGNDVKVLAGYLNEKTVIGSLRGLPFSGPRHIAVQDHIIYVLNELSNSIDVFDTKNGDKILQKISNLANIPAVGSASAAAIKIHPNKKFLYTTSRGLEGNPSNTIQLFHISDTGLLTLSDTYSTLGSVPRDFAIDPLGLYCLVANQDSDSIVVFGINQETGALSQIGEPFQVPTPVCLVFN